MGNIITFFLIALLNLFSISNGMADYTDPISKTNVNKQTDEFEKSVEDWKGLQEQLENNKNSAMDSFKGTPKALEFISDKSKEEIEGHVAELDKIRANDLADVGRKKLIESNFIEDIYPDETKPLYIKHKEDADAIADATSKMLGNLLGMLKNIGVDCKTVKGDKVVEPEYFIDIKRTPTKDTVYDKKICEELRNKYNCTDSLKLRCKTPISLTMLNSRFVSNLGVAAQTADGYVQFGYGSTMKGGRGTQFDYEMSFEVGNLSGVRQFILKDVSWDDHIRITLNDHQIFAGPIGGDRLEFTSKDFSFGWRRVVVDGSGTPYSAEYDTWFRNYPNLDLKPFLIEGINVIKIRLIIAGHGGLLVGFQTNIDSCSEWSEEWNEECKLQ